MANLFDSTNAPTLVPEEIIVGDFIQFKLTEYSDDYPNNLYTMRFIARVATGNNTEITITATADGDDYLFSVSSAVSADYDVGHYHYQIEIERNADNERIIIDRGIVDIKTDYDNNVDVRHHAEIMLDKIETILEGKADSDVSSYSINGRSLTKFSPKELIDWRTFYRQEVSAIKKRERIKHGRRTNSTILGRF